MELPSVLGEPVDMANQIGGQQDEHTLPIQHRSFDIEQARELVDVYLNQISPDLRENVNRAIHAHPETCYEEFFAHETLTLYLEKWGFNVKRSMYGLQTSFEATFGQGGRQVVFCAEYDALPGIGHGCGHNLIATSSVAGFLGTAHIMSKLSLPGRLRILGTPAEEGGGGKAKLILAGAFEPPEDIAAAIMAHPISNQLMAENSPFPISGISGVGGAKTLANHIFKVEFHGKASHAAGEPWNGINALDAAVAAYQSVGLLRQQIHPEERIHAVIENGGAVANVIPDYTRMSWNVRSPTIAQADVLLEKVKKCIEGSATASGCSTTYITSPTYMDLRANQTLCDAYAEDMKKLDRVIIPVAKEASTASTDMGNVSYTVPSFHGVFAIPTPPGVAIHSAGFAVAAGKDDAHIEAMQCAKGMALLALRVLTDDDISARARQDFGALGYYSELH